jgi:hypothetical protein
MLSLLPSDISSASYGYLLRKDIKEYFDYQSIDNKKYIAEGVMFNDSTIP